MQSLIGAALLAVPGAALYELAPGSTKVNDPEVIASLNAEEGSLWHAATQKFFEGMTFEDSRVFLGARISEHLNETFPERSYTMANDDLPTEFDSRKQWPGLIHPIRDQEQCGSCWAFSASEVLSDRVAIVTGKPSPALSPEDLVSCDQKDSGCNGGYLDRAWQYLVTTGAVTDSCWPYQAGSGRAPKCRNTCVDGEAFTRTHAKNAYAINGAADMQKDLVQNGPIQVAFMVYRSFMSYHSGIYHKKKKEKTPEGGHAVKIVGYGTVGKHQYWLVANSWNTDWGEDGFFRILRGHNECGLEKQGSAYAGLPAVSAELRDEIVV